jgi:predicted transposase YdaD
MQLQQTTNANQATPPITPINPETVMEHSESPTAIILAVTILITTLMGSVTNLVQVMIRGMAQHSKSIER